MMPVSPTKQMSIAETDFLCFSAFGRKQTLSRLVCVITVTEQSEGRVQMCVHYHQRISIKFSIMFFCLETFLVNWFQCRQDSNAFLFLKIDFCIPHWIRTLHTLQTFQNFNSRNNFALCGIRKFITTFTKCPWINYWGSCIQHTTS